MSPVPPALPGTAANTEPVAASAIAAPQAQDTCGEPTPAQQKQFNELDAQYNQTLAKLEGSYNQEQKGFSNQLAALDDKFNQLDDEVCKPQGGASKVSRRRLFA